MRSGRVAPSSEPALCCFPGLAWEAARRAEEMFVAGVDEVGRGCWAGPVLAAAVILPERCYLQPELLQGVRDSKQLLPHQRERLYQRILELALAVGVGLRPATFIDAYGIVAASRAAMLEAVRGLQVRPDLLLVDALALPDAGIPYHAPAHADETYLCVAAASIVAKVLRDRLMTELDAAYPGYGLAAHKGYGTPAHVRALLSLGVSPLHRRSFAPVRYLLGVRDCAPALPPAADVPLCPVPHPLV